MAYSKKDEDVHDAIIRVDRTAVFQEGKCRILLTKIALLLFTGEKFPTNEATSLFFGISKLFQNKDASLRQMVYLIIKELAHSAEDVIMVTSSIMKDTAVQSDVLYRANAIRALCRIIDATTVQAIERLIKTAIVDKTPSVSSAALVSSYHLLPIARDVVRRWQSETQEAASASKSGGFSLGLSGAGNQHVFSAASPNHITQYHAIGLLYQMRSHDRMALVKMVQQFGAPGAVKSPAATVMLVRLAAKLAEEDAGLRKPMIELLDGWLRHKSEMVNFEAAKAICDLRDVSNTEITQAIHVLQMFLSSPRAVTKFAAIRILHTFASFKPDAVRACNPDIEALISNSNRSIATFAITTLLKTGNEASVDRLMKQISGFMSDITDEFKITVVEAIRTLCLKFPNKQAGMLTFLSELLRDEGGYEFKRSVVESMFDLIKFVPESKEDALAHLCEFIEDCEFTKLAVRILHLLGREGPKTPQPTKYIRYIYNRVVLENAIVRAAAVTALSKFGVGQQDPEVKRSVTVLLTRCLDDTDDEVRDRAALNLRLMAEEDEMAKRFISNDSMYSLPVLEHQLVMYVTADDKGIFAAPFDLGSIPIVTREQADAEDRTKKMTTATPTLKAPSAGPKKTAAAEADPTASSAAMAQKYTQQLQQIPELKSYGPVLKSSSVVELTESEMEYVVSAIKHIFKEHVVVQYDVKNTLPETILEDVTVLATPAGDDEVALEEDFIIPISKLKPNEPSTAYVAFKKTGSDPFPVSSFSNVLKFTVKEIDPSSGEPEEEGYEDDYEVEDLEINGSDYVIPAYAGSFSHIWEQVGAKGEEAEETLQLSSIKSIADATEQLAKTLSLQPLEGTDVPVNTSTHTLKLYGKTITGGRVAANVKMAFSARTGVTTKISVRGEEEGIAALVLAVDLLNPTPQAEARKHKLKTLVPAPRSFFMDVKCPGCFTITTVFSHAQTVVICAGCSTVLCQPTGGKARLTEGCSFRRK
ncbi:MAG: coatomer subunit gamma [Caeruleum heppii]|nr:MAG: coatomer subunit gamma [Caeruleum heppii]